MLGARMLVILNALTDGEAAIETVLSAMRSAARPYALRFVLPSALCDAFQLRASRTEELRRADILFTDGALLLSDAPSFLTNETHFLFLIGAHAFAPRWDIALYSALRGQNTLLTASIRPPREEKGSSEPQQFRTTAAALRRIAHKRRESGSQGLGSDEPTRVFLKNDLSKNASNAGGAAPIPAEACLPALSDHFEDGRVQLCYGLPLVCSQGPVSTLVIDPALLFGPVRFLHEATLDLDTLSIAAYTSGFSVYALSETLLWPLSEPPPATLRRPVPEVLPGTTLARFEQLAGFRYDQRSAGVKTTWGLFGLEDTYPQRLPRGVAIAHRARAARMRLQESYMPLLVTAFIDLPNPRRPVASYILRFGFLKAIQSLPLLLFTGGREERRLRASFPNTQSYPDNSVLPKRFLFSGMTPAQHFRRSKPLLLQRAASRRPEFTHVAWVDIDALGHPICPDAVPDFAALMDGLIHLATVDGVPDLSFLVIPVALLSLLARDAEDFTQLDIELKRGLSEEALWARMIQKHPERFCLHPMPYRRLLFLTVFDKCLLSQRLRAALSALSPPIRPERPQTGDRNAKRTPQGTRGENG